MHNMAECVQKVNKGRHVLPEWKIKIGLSFMVLDIVYTF